MFETKKKHLQESGLVDWPVFSELVAMDEDEEGFSQGLFQTFVDQFEETYTELEENIKEKDLDKLSSLGHYLKGSAAALGLVTVAEQCERIQNYGHRNNCDDFELSDDGVPKDEAQDSYWLALVKDAMEKVQDAFKELKAALNEYFGELADSLD